MTFINKRQIPLNVKLGSEIFLKVQVSYCPITQTEILKQPSTLMKSNKSLRSGKSNFYHLALIIVQQPLLGRFNLEDLPLVLVTDNFTSVIINPLMKS